MTKPTPDDLAYDRAARLADVEEEIYNSEGRTLGVTREQYIERAALRRALWAEERLKCQVKLPDWFPGDGYE